MAFDRSNLKKVRYGEGVWKSGVPNVWFYQTDDPSIQVDSTGYFNGAIDIINKGDFIFFNADMSGTPESGLLLVNTNNGFTVDCSNATHIGLGDDR